MKPMLQLIISDHTCTNTRDIRLEVTMFHLTSGGVIITDAAASYD